MTSLFTTQIGVPQSKRRKRDSTRQQQQPTWHSPTLAAKSPKTIDARRTRMPVAVRKACLRLAYDVLDPQIEGVVSAQMLQDIGEELEYLVKIGKTEQERDTQRFIVEHGQEEYDSLESAEKRAHKGARDLDEPTTEEEDYDDTESDLEGFIVPSDEETEIQKTITESQESPKVYTQEEGTNLSEID